MNTTIFTSITDCCAFYRYISSFLYVYFHSFALARKSVLLTLSFLLFYFSTSSLAVLAFERACEPICIISIVYYVLYCILVTIKLYTYKHLHTNTLNTHTSGHSKIMISDSIVRLICIVYIVWIWTPQIGIIMYDILQWYKFCIGLNNIAQRTLGG